MEDKDSVRVDLLKFRRKAYLSYPEGSEERKHFLKTILLNELKMTEKDLPQDLINFVVEGNNVVLWNSLKQFFLWLGFSLLCVAGFLVYSKILHSLFSFIFLLGGACSLGLGVQYLREYWEYKKSLQVIKQYTNDMQKHMNKISNDIKRLDGPR